MAAVAAFSFEAFGLTMSEVADKLDELTNEIITQEGGEPWLVVTDSVEKKAIAPNILDPKSWIYMGQREVMFAGPTPLGEGPSFRDGFRPQA